MKPEELVQKQVSVTTNLLTWLAIHGNLCLALRHPQNRGPSRQYVTNFTKNLGKKLVEWEVITEQQLEATEKLEMEEGSTDFQ
jgi:hypothetical protein